MIISRTHDYERWYGTPVCVSPDPPGSVTSWRNRYTIQNDSAEQMISVVFWRCKIYELQAHAKIKQPLSPTALRLPFLEITSNFRDAIIRILPHPSPLRWRVCGTTT